MFGGAWIRRPAGCQGTPITSGPAGHPWPALNPIMSMSVRIAIFPVFGLRPGSGFADKIRPAY